MKPAQYHAKKLAAFFRRHKIATLDELQKALGDPTKRTVFRKLEQLSYLSSYSHRGKYYTLHGIAKFNTKGLWCCRSVWFSRLGNLIETVRALVDQSEAGYNAFDLKVALHVEVKHPLVQLVRAGELKRDKVQGRFVYFSANAAQHRRQQKHQRGKQRQQLATLVVTNPDLAAEEAKAVVLLFLSTLDERQRRLYAGLEALKLGHGGDHHIADLLSMHPQTVARGRQELVEGDWDPDRLRTPGGGRPSVKKKRRT